MHTTLLGRATRLKTAPRFAKRADLTEADSPRGERYARTDAWIIRVETFSMIQREEKKERKKEEEEGEESRRKVSLLSLSLSLSPLLWKEEGIALTVT